MIKETTKKRFLDKIKKTKTCWWWQGCKNNKGYGNIRVNGKTEYSHRLSYRIYKGEIPQRKFVCHHCDNPSCVNPAHLFCGTNTDNLRDASKKGRLKGKNGLKGSKNPSSKLHEQQVKQIKKQIINKITYKEIAKIYKVDISTIGLIARNKTWKHV